MLKNKLFQINELCKAEKPQDKSIEELEETAKLRGIKNYNNVTKERNYMKYFNNSTNDEIKSKINDIRLILNRLGNIVTKNDREKIKKEFYEIEKRQNLSNNEKEKIYDDLVTLANTLDKKEE